MAAVTVAAAVAPVLVVAPAGDRLRQQGQRGGRGGVQRARQAAAVPMVVSASARNQDSAPAAVAAALVGKGKAWAAEAAAAAVAAAAVAVVAATWPLPAEAAPAVRLPPLDKDPKRCERAFVGNTIGQANAVSDKVLDLRQCDFSNNKTDIVGKTLAGALMVDANFEGANLQEVVLTKAYAANANFRNADFTNAVVDRVTFEGSDMSGAVFKNAVLSGATFDNVNLTGADFEEALLGSQDAQKLCRNPTLEPTARALIGCRK